jgi:hypothetical protein
VRLRSGSLPAYVQSALHALLSLPELPATDEVYYDSKLLWPATSLERLKAIMPPANSDA